MDAYASYPSHGITITTAIHVRDSTLGAIYNAALATVLLYHIHSVCINWRNNNRFQLLLRVAFMIIIRAFTVLHNPAQMKAHQIRWQIYIYDFLAASSSRIFKNSKNLPKNPRSFLFARNLIVKKKPKYLYYCIMSTCASVRCSDPRE